MKENPLLMLENCGRNSATPIISAHCNATAVKTRTASPHRPRFPIDYPIPNRLIPNSLDVVAQLKQWGPAVILSDHLLPDGQTKRFFRPANDYKMERVTDKARIQMEKLNKPLYEKELQDRGRARERDYLRSLTIARKCGVRESGDCGPASSRGEGGIAT